MITPMTLTPGVWFWRAAGMRAGDAGTSYGPTWQFVVGHGSAAVNTAWGNTTDFNGDGYADLAVAERQSVLVFYGSPTGLRTTPTVLGVSVSMGTLDFISVLQCGGDLNGDGFPELLVTVRYVTDASVGARATLVFPGGVSGVSAMPVVTYDALGYSVSPAGDFNLDGYGDLAIDDSLTLGTPAGWPSDGRTLRPGGPFPSGISIGDTNGDGFGDIALSGVISRDGGLTYVSRIYFGTASGLLGAPALEMAAYGSARPLGDIDGDGYADFANTPNAGTMMAILRGNATAPTMFTTLNAALLSAVGDVDADGDDDVLVSGDVATSLWLGARTFPLTIERRIRNPAGGELPRTVVRSLGGVGDIERDGLTDFAVAAEGWLYVYAGAATIVGTPARSIADVLGASIAH
ncbi:MAG: VCBS repeat-containing protein [Polyangiales bacterium]